MDSKRVEEDYKALVASNTWSAVYQRITQRCYRYTCVEAKKVENKPLNRYRDVNPYDHSRIVLRREGFDYINANLVKVERANRQYILTQGPLVTTSGHFWLMIWEQKCPGIIMLNKVFENLEIKCHWYWPHVKEKRTEKEIFYADVNMTVSQVSEQDCNYYTIRKLRVTNHDTEESRDIWQFHYTNWPDFGVPESPHAFLVFLKHVNDYNALDGKEGPAVVHCSAGIGRSGTFCLVDSVLVLVKNEGQANVSVEEVLLEMRRYRMGLIQTSEQFRFSYKAIIEGIKRMDPDYEPNSDLVPEPEHAVARQEEESPPPPPPRGESLGQPPARPLPAIPVSASMNTQLDLRRRERASNIVIKGSNIMSPQFSGLPTLAALPLLSHVAAQIFVEFPTDAFGNPLAVENQMIFENLRIIRLPGQPTTPTSNNSDTQSSMSYEDPPLLNSSEDFYISSEDLVTYETSGEYANADMMDIDPLANQGGESLNLIDMSSNVDSDGSDALLTPPRPRHALPASPAGSSCEESLPEIFDLSSSVESDGSDTPPTPPPRPRHVTPGSSTDSSYEELYEDCNITEYFDSVEAEGGAGEKSGLRRRRNDALAERVADMKKRSRKADRWNSVKRSFLKPLAISVGVGLLAATGVLIYSYRH